MLTALLDRQSLSMSMLACEAGISPSTASEHLAKLVAGGLLIVRRHGKYRYYELASAEVAGALEALAGISPVHPVRSLRAGTRINALRCARSCYNHLAGQLGVAVMKSLLGRGYLIGGDGVYRPEDVERDRISGPGRDLDYALTEDGLEFFRKLGVRLTLQDKEFHHKSKRPLVAYCVDWTEQRHHLGGLAGEVLLRRFLELGWLQRGVTGKSRAFAITDGGRSGFAEHFGIDTDQFGTPGAATDISVQ